MRIRFLGKLNTIGRVSQKGFTIMELMVATTVFTVIMLILTIAVIHFTNGYYSGVTQSTTQTVARNIANSVAQAIQFSGEQYISSAPIKGEGAYCVGGELFSYKLGFEQEPSSNSANPQNVLVESPQPGCSATNIKTLMSYSSNLPAQGLLGENMWLSNFTISPVTSATLPAGGVTTVNSILYKISVRVLYGSCGLLKNTVTGNSNICPPPAAPPGYNALAVGSKIYCIGTTGSQFCATSGLSSVVEARIQ